MSDFDGASVADLGRAINRDRFVKDELAGRVAALVKENLELLSIIKELQQDLADIRQGQELLNAVPPVANGESSRIEQPSLFVSD